MSGETSGTAIRKPFDCAMVALTVAALAAFAAVTWLVAIGATQSFDDAALEAIYDSNTSASLVAFRAVSFAGSMWAIATVVGLAAVLFAFRKAYWTALFILASVSAIWLMNEALKLAVARSRPGLGSDAFAAGYSYPSAHTMIGISLYLTLAFIASSYAESRAKKVIICISASAFCALLGFSRLFLGVHYPTDVIGGALLGVAWVILMMEVWLRFVRPA